MRKVLFACTLFLTAFASIKEGPWFSGKIVYHNQFKTLAGKDFSAKLAPVLGAENLYYISDNNYKAYTEKKQLLELYTGENNKFLFFMNGQAGPVTDAATGTPGAVVTPLAETTTVAGYACQSLKVENDGVTTVYYYSPKVRVNPERYTQHLMGDWYTYLRASNGALPLRFIVTNAKQGFVWTSDANSVQTMLLTAADFTATASAQ